MSVTVKHTNITISKEVLVELIKANWKSWGFLDPIYANFEPDARTLCINEDQRGAFESISLDLKPRT